VEPHRQTSCVYGWTFRRRPPPRPQSQPQLAIARGSQGERKRVCTHPLPNLHSRRHPPHPQGSRLFTHRLGRQGFWRKRPLFDTFGPASQTEICLGVQPRWRERNLELQHNEGVASVPHAGTQVLAAWTCHLRGFPVQPLPLVPLAHHTPDVVCGHIPLFASVQLLQFSRIQSQSHVPPPRGRVRATRVSDFHRQVEDLLGLYRRLQQTWLRRLGDQRRTQCVEQRKIAPERDSGGPKEVRWFRKFNEGRSRMVLWKRECDRPRTLWTNSQR